MTDALELIRGLKVADLGARLAEGVMGDRAVRCANANGRRYESRVVRIFTVRGGTIVRVQSFFDTAEYPKALYG